MPTPVLSFSVRYLNCDAGIVITASHNPKEYNGYKVYDKYGCQLVPKYADKVISYINNVKDIKSVKHMNLNMALSNGYLTYIGDEVLNSYISEVEKMAVYKEASNLKIVYTPLHGTGDFPVRKVLLICRLTSLLSRSRLLLTVISQQSDHRTRKRRMRLIWHLNRPKEQMPIWL